MNFRKSRILAILVVSVIMASISLQAKQGKIRQNTADRNYNTSTVETISGTVTDITSLNKWGIHISVKTSSGIMGVHLGPEWFLKDKISLAAGDTVTVTGSKVNMGGENVIIAKSISKGNVTVQLRKDNGVPLWAGSGKGKNK